VVKPLKIKALLHLTNSYRKLTLTYRIDLIDVPLALYLFRIYVTLFSDRTPLSISPHGGKRFLYFFLYKRVFVPSPVGEGQDGGINQLLKGNQELFEKPV
jgi:hypothetical protein